MPALFSDYSYEYTRVLKLLVHSEFSKLVLIKSIKINIDRISVFSASVYSLTECTSQTRILKSV